MKRYVYTSLAMLGGVILGYLVGSTICGVTVACFIWIGMFDKSILSSETALYVTAFSSLLIGILFAWYFFGRKVWRKHAPSVSVATTTEVQTAQ